MSLEIKTISQVAYLMYLSASKIAADVTIEDTYAPVMTGLSSSDMVYYSFIALSQRLLYKGEVIGYITYRSTRTTPVASPKFSSIEIFNAAYDRSSGTKFKFKTYPTSTDFFSAVVGYLASFINNNI